MSASRYQPSAAATQNPLEFGHGWKYSSTTRTLRTTSAPRQQRVREEIRGLRRRALDDAAAHEDALEPREVARRHRPPASPGTEELRCGRVPGRLHDLPALAERRP